MFKVEPVYISDAPNDGDPFAITLSRNLLRVMAAELNASSSVAAQLMGAKINKELSKS